MRREGRQHGFVVYYTRPFDLQPRRTRVVNGFDKVPTRARTTKVSSKPTNHSKYTSRRFCCIDCLNRPVSKARSKTKGAHRLHSVDVVNNYRLVSFRLVGPSNGIMDILKSDEDYEDSYDDDQNYCHCCLEDACKNCDDTIRFGVSDSAGDMKIEHCKNTIAIRREGKEVVQEEDNDGFCHLEFNMWEHEDDDWCVIGQKL